MYKKYINKGGKKVGPYYYASIRLKNGGVKSVYLGSDEKKARSKEKALRKEQLKSVHKRSSATIKKAVKSHRKSFFNFRTDKRIPLSREIHFKERVFLFFILIIILLGFVHFSGLMAVDSYGASVGHIVKERYSDVLSGGITGEAIINQDLVSNEYSYDVNILLNESSEFYIKFDSADRLVGLKLTGRFVKSDNGLIKAFLSDDFSGESYVVLDSDEFEGEEGMLEGITGRVVDALDSIGLHSLEEIGGDELNESEEEIASYYELHDLGLIKGFNVINVLGEKLEYKLINVLDGSYGVGIGDLQVYGLGSEDVEMGGWFAYQEYPARGLIEPVNVSFERVFGFDVSGLEVSNETTILVESISEEDYLYGCEYWDFEFGICLSDWIYLFDLKNQSGVYSAVINKKIMAFAEGVFDPDKDVEEILEEVFEENVDDEIGNEVDVFIQLAEDKGFDLNNVTIFEQECEDTCFIKDFLGAEQTVKVYVNGALFEISKIDFVIVQDIENQGEFSVTIIDELGNSLVDTGEEISETNVSEEGVVVDIKKLENYTEEVRQYDVVINQPVKWKKKLSLNKTVNAVDIEVPLEAKNITIKKANASVEVTTVGSGENISSEGSGGGLFGELAGNLVTSNAITGFAVGGGYDGPTVVDPSDEAGEDVDVEEGINVVDVVDEAEVKQISLELVDEIEGLEVEFETPGPVTYEEDLSGGVGKKIVVSSDVHYENILAYTNIPESPSSSISLYRTTNGTREPAEIIEYVDSNNNSRIDVIYWVVPHLSNESYEVELNILNVKSYPTVGGNWTVKFETIGKSNLTISGFNGTTWTNYSDDGYDLKFLDVRCGNETVNYTWINESVFIEDYSCDKIGYESSLVITYGEHTLKFNFGDDEDFAYNTAGGISITELSFFMNDYSTGRYSNDNSDFEEFPIVANDYGAISEKCEIWTCAGWSNSAARQGAACSGFWNCTYWNGETCETWECTNWVNSGTQDYARYCSGFWNCTDWKNGVCETWNCTEWTLTSSVTDDEHCTGNWNCSSWNEDVCEEWNCSSWTSGPTNNKDYYCHGGYNCTTWNGNYCETWECLTWLGNGTDLRDKVCSGVWDCTYWKGNVCGNWNCTVWAKATANNLDVYCNGGMNCTTWSGDYCDKWQCGGVGSSGWLQSSAGYDRYCSGGWNCTKWKKKITGTPGTGTVTLTVNGPKNNSHFATPGNVTFNVTITESSGGTSEVKIYATNGSATYDPQDDDLVYYDSNIFNSTIIEYNWTIPVLDVEPKTLVLYHFDNRSEYGENDTLANDFAGNYNGTYEGSMTVFPEANLILAGGLYFSNDDRVHVNGCGYACYNLTNRTYLAWLHPLTNTVYRTIFAGYAPGVQDGFIVALDDTDGIADWNISIASDSGTAQISKAGFFTQNEWVHLGIVTNENGSVFIYKNGAEFTKGTIPAPSDSSQNFNIGTINGANNWWGYMDEIAIVNRFFSPDDVLDSYRLKNSTYQWRVEANNSVGSNVSEERNFAIGDIYEITSCDTVLDFPGDYRLDGNIATSNDGVCINISSNDVNLDCKGNSIAYAGVSYTVGKTYIGAYAYRKDEQNTNLTIANCTINGWVDQIQLYNASNNTLLNLDFGKSASGLGRDGIEIRKSRSNFISNISATKLGHYGLFLNNSDSNVITNLTFYDLNHGVVFQDSNYTILENSTILNSTKWDFFMNTNQEKIYCNTRLVNVNGTGNRPILYYNDSLLTLQNWDNNFSELVLCNADYSVLRNINLSHSTDDRRSSGIILLWTDYSNISNVFVNSTYVGFKLDHSDYNWVENLTTDVSEDIGTFVTNSQYNRLNNLSIASAVKVGFSFHFASDYNNLTFSSIINSTTSGIKMDNASLNSPNLIYNNFFNNSLNMQHAGTLNKSFWNITDQTGTRKYSDGTNMGGNFWAQPDGKGYSQICADAGTDGFCDLAYNVTTNTSCSIGVNCSDNTDFLPYSDEYSIANNAPDNASVNINSTDGSNKTLQDLNCFAMIYDDDDDKMNVSIQWWSDAGGGGDFVLNFTFDYNESYVNGTSFNSSLDSENTSKNNIWKCTMRLHDGTDASDWVNSTGLTILNSLPGTPTLLIPSNGNLTQDRTPTFSWEPAQLYWNGTDNSSDPDYDRVTYYFNVTCLSTAGGGCDDDRQISVGENVTNCDSNGDGEVDPADNCTYTLAERFRYFYDDNYYYSWTASGYDGTGEGSQAVPWRINISVFVSVTMLNNTVNFTTILSGQNKNTTSCDPGSSLNDCPLWLENSGNLNISLNITGPPSNVFWSTQSISQNPNYFSIKVDRGVGEFSFDQSKSNTSYIDLPTAGVERRIVYDWDYGGEADNQADDLTIDINITAPSTEPIGSKGVKLNFTGWYPG